MCIHTVVLLLTCLDGFTSIIRNPPNIVLVEPVERFPNTGMPYSVMFLTSMYNTLHCITLQLPAKV